MFADARLTNFIANVLAVLAVSAMLVSVIVWTIRQPYFAIQRVQIEALHNETLSYVTPAAVDATVAGRLKGNFFTIDLDNSRQLMETAPWVRRAQVKRVWPNTLLVRIEEQQPLAYWNENEMINTWGEAFAGNEAVLSDDVALPQLNGPSFSERLVVQRYAEVARWIAPMGLNIREVTLSPRYAWEVVLSDGMRLNLGRDPAADIADPHGRSGALPFAARIERFVQAWPALLQRLGDRAVASADLRYTNGFAITLAPLTPTPVK
ncbi:cell division protein FtsQ/DivIB [Paenalcaligenes niemegkensis]|uniref:cell division protein FtsQ/DivIB n=1 Tax=Paenalcaligenes niemegkensis TaxID=2895469 RepID=UPI001EE7FCE6|nr:cell division protein FtsQ/DivIB [Paenalcaligenes niemegkensis]MCQ9615893.1 cell division protein FtsQ/DivIB [Paenalcaligenes niemegkensis]